jgi:hypothetical protein
MIQLEILESRDCPSTITTSLHTLLVVGDAGDNTVQITDKGNGVVTASVDGGLAVTQSAINHIVVQARTGNDTVNYSLTGPLITPQVLDIGLGVGDTAVNKNVVNLDFGGKAIDAYFAAIVAGTPGQDTVKTANFTGDIRNTALIAFFGGAATDTANVAYQGRLTGALGVYLQGQGGNDNVSATVALNSVSTGALEAVVWGGGGDDTLTLQVQDSVPSRLGYYFALLDGGIGNDTCVTTTNVQVINC